MRCIFVGLFLSLFFALSGVEIVDGSALYSLEHYLEINGFQLSPLHSGVNEGYMTETQKLQFNQTLQNYQNIRKIAEVGLNGGHSAENFFKNCPQLEKFSSFDIQLHKYTKAAKEYLASKYQNIFEFIQGDSMQTVPEYAASHPDVKFDLIYIDGSHTYENCRQDILNFRYLTASNSILWIDDYNDCSVQRAIEDCVNDKVIQILNVHSSEDPIGGGRVWAEARYIPIPSENYP